ncbi:hypothetical protein [Streptomyces specialis]|uniref:hypothetical protein n=1 Tax=Streptomyces specialis TaxID=498367 RepID=UPI000A5551E1|nr:hypothetical protein [Streptomyces specialis]
MYLDALPPVVEVSLVPALQTLDEILEAGGHDLQLLIAAMVVRKSVSKNLDVAPQDLQHLILRLPKSPAEG